MDNESQIDFLETDASVARAELSEAISVLQNRLTPSHLAASLGGSIRQVVAPLADPIIAQTKSASGVIVLAGAAAALVFSLGRESVSPQRDDCDAATGQREAFVDVADNNGNVPSGRQRKSISAQKRSHPLQVTKTLALAAGALAVGAAIGGAAPLSETEKQLGKGLGRDFRSELNQFAKTHSRDAMANAVNAFGVAKGIGGLLGVLALLGSQLGKK